MDNKHMEKAIIVYVAIAEPHKIKNRESALTDSLKELNDHLADGWSVKQSYPMGGGSEIAACSLVIMEQIR